MFSNVSLVSYVSIVSKVHIVSKVIIVSKVHIVSKVSIHNTHNDMQQRTYLTIMQLNTQLKQL